MDLQNFHLLVFQNANDFLSSFLLFLHNQLFALLKQFALHLQHNHYNVHILKLYHHYVE